MKKAWWILISILVLIIIVGILIWTFSGEKPVTQLQGGVVIVASSGSSTQFPGVFSSDSDAGTQTSDSSSNVPPPDLGTMPALETTTAPCWRCPIDKVLLNLPNLGTTYEQLTDAMVSNWTNCLNKTLLVPASCTLTNVTTNQTVPNNATNSTCGNGICENGENSVNCAQDCTSAGDGSSGGGSDSGGGESAGNSEGNTNTNTVQNTFAGASYTTCTIDKKCVLVRGEGSSVCSSDVDCINFDGSINGNHVQFSPPEYSSILYDVLRRLFGLP